MLKNIFLWIMANIFKIRTETTNDEISHNDMYVEEYSKTGDINFDAIFSNKLANYVASDSTIIIEGSGPRVDLIDKTAQSLWKRIKKITSMALGTGGVVIIPYVKGGKIYYNIIPQNRMTIDMKLGEDIICATVLAEKKVINTLIARDTYYRFINYKIENGNLKIEQKYTNQFGAEIIDVPEFWKDMPQIQKISNVEKVPFGFIKSPINNRATNDKYGVPITYGCENTILEIRECLKQIEREFKNKEGFVALDYTMFNKVNDKYVLPEDGLFKTFNGESDDLWREFSPQIRESSYYARLEELYTRLEREVGTSKGIISMEDRTSRATATEIRRSMYDTFTIVADMQKNIESGMDDFFTACNILANAYNLTPNGDYNVVYDWSYSLTEDSQETFAQLSSGVNMGIIKKEELRNWLKPSEDMKESKKVIDEIAKEEQENTEQLIADKMEQNIGENGEKSIGEKAIEKQPSKNNTKD